MYVYLLACAFGMLIAGVLGLIALTGRTAAVAIVLFVIFAALFTATLIFGRSRPQDWAWPSRKHL